MMLCLSASEREQWNNLKKTMADNDRLLRYYSAYLRQCPRFITAELMERMQEGGGVTSAEAYCALLGAAFDLDEENAADRRFSRRYLAPSVQELKKESYSRNPYYAHIEIPEKHMGSWMLRSQRFHAYEALICRDPVFDSQFREIPQLGFFPCDFPYPAVLQDGVEWMTVTPNEIASMEQAVADARGRVVTFGLGLGYYAYMVSRKPRVTSVTVVERDPRAVALFRDVILPQFGEKGKIRIVCEDALRYAESSRMKEHDFVFADLWHDVSDGLKLYLRLRKSEEKTPWLTWRYWIESSLLSQLRRMVFDRLCAFEEKPDGQGERIESFARIRELLGDAHLKRLAGQLREI